MSGSISFGSGTLSSGVATLTTTTIPAGPNSLTAAYAPGALDQVFLPSTSLPLSFTVKSPPYLTTSSLTGLAQLSLSPSTLAFGTLGQGVQSVAKTVTVHNYSGTTQPVNTTSDGSNSSDFAADNSVCGSVANGSTCALSVTFTPSTKAAESATITVTAGSNSAPLTVSGKGK